MCFVWDLKIENPFVTVMLRTAIIMPITLTVICLDLTTTNSLYSTWISQRHLNFSFYKTGHCVSQKPTPLLFSSLLMVHFLKIENNYSLPSYSLHPQLLSIIPLKSLLIFSTSVYYHGYVHIVPIALSASATAITS